MLHDQNLPKFLWAEAYNNAVYFQNRSPHKVLGNVTLEEAFTGKRPEINHLRIFGCIAYCHFPAERRTKLDPTSEKGRYSETSKAYRIYIPSTRKTVLRRDIKFEEERALHKSCQDRDISETKVPNQEEEPSPKGADLPTEGQREEEQPTLSKKRKPKWAEQLLKEASEQVKSPKTSVRTSIPPQRYSGHATLMSNIIDFEPTCFEEAIEKKAWRDSMMEEYASIIKNDVWEIVPRPKDKSIVSSKWIYKIKHVTDGSIDKYKARFVALGFS
jgi:hypothetical protein